jgi:hypothetical protein
MTSLDDRLEMAQNRIIYFFVNNEQYINEYITLPFFYESVYHGVGYIKFRSFILSLLILRQILQKNNNKQIPFDIIYLVAPIFAYIGLVDKYSATVFYASFYSINWHESIFLGLITGYLNTKSFLSAYIFHILYIAIRNNIKIAIEPIERTTLTTLNLKLSFYTPPTFYERLYVHNELVNNFVNMRLEPWRKAFFH